MRVITERGEYVVDETGPGEFSVEMIACTCDDQTAPYLIACSTGKVGLHGCLHPNGHSITLPSIHVGLGVEFSFNSGVNGTPPAPYQVTENCCRLNRIVEILP